MTAFTAAVFSMALGCIVGLSMSVVRFYIEVK